MKQIYILAAFLTLTLGALNAQTVTLSGACNGVNGDYLLSDVVNGKPSYVLGDYAFQWSGIRWEHTKISEPEKVGMYNELDTDNPPASSFSNWTSGLCTPSGDISGDGTSTTLSLGDFQVTNSAIRLFPNPASTSIKISGLTREENYSIYNIMGSKITHGKISNNQRMSIQHLSNGLYLLKFDDGNTIKLIKE
ncbi:MAG: T9SS type A sorting domain-containing protein [Gelidibacter sp.]